MFHSRILRLTEAQQQQAQVLIDGGSSPTKACMAVLRQDVVPLYCPKCKGLPTRHEWLPATESFVCLICGEVVVLPD